MGQHTLIVTNLRDTDAKCSCGMWSMLGTTTDDRPEEQIRAGIQEQFQRHLDSVERRRLRESKRTT